MNSQSRPAPDVSKEFASTKSEYYVIRIQEPNNDNTVKYKIYDPEDGTPDLTGNIEGTSTDVYFYDEQYYALIPSSKLRNKDQILVWWTLRGPKNKDDNWHQKVTFVADNKEYDLMKHVEYIAHVKRILKDGKKTPFTSQAAADLRLQKEKEGQQVFFPDRINHKEIEKVDAIVEKSKAKLQSWTQKSSASKGVKIGICASGGSLRAALGTRFFMHHVSKIDPEFFDSISYMCSLSGSTWFTVDWCFNNNLYTENSEYKTNDHLGRDNAPTNWVVNKVDSLFSQLTNAVRDHFNSNIVRNDSILEHWALLLGNAYFRDNYRDDKFLQTVRLATMLDKLRSDKPWPIMTAIASENFEAVNWSKIYRKGAEISFRWVEFTPAQVAFVNQAKQSLKTGHIIPAGFGCTIDKQGRKIASAPQDSLNQLMALWGSAMTATFQEGTTTGQDPFTTDNNDYWLDGYFVDPFRFSSWEDNSQRLGFRDAGISFNVPLPPLLEKERGVEVIVVVDVSGNLQTNLCGNELIKAAVWAQRNNVRFPKTPEELIELRGQGKLKQPITFPGGQGVPSVVYVPIYIPVEGKSDMNIGTFDLDARDVTKRGLLFDKTEKLWRSIRNEVKQRVAERL